MTIENINSTLTEIKTFFDSIGLPFMLGGSMLKGMICTGRPYDTDSEIDLYIMERDLKKVFDKVSAHPGFEMLPGVVEYRAVYHRLDDGLVASGIVYEHELGYFFNTVYDNFICLPKDNFEPMKPYWFNNTWWNIPGNWDKIYELFYGKDWIEDRPTYHWAQSGALIRAADLNELNTVWSAREVMLNE